MVVGRQCLPIEIKGTSIDIKNKQTKHSSHLQRQEEGPTEGEGLSEESLPKRQMFPCEVADNNMLISLQEGKGDCDYGWRLLVEVHLPPPTVPIACLFCHHQ